MNYEIKRIIIDQEHKREADYPFQIKPNFATSTLGCNIEKSPQGPIISFVFKDSIKSFLWFNETILYKEYKLSPVPVDVLSSDKIVFETNIAQGLILKRKRCGIIYIWTMTVDPGYNYVQRFLVVYVGI